jgi:hypothetical protein
MMEWILIAMIATLVLLSVTMILPAATAVPITLPATATAATTTTLNQIH